MKIEVHLSNPYTVTIQRHALEHLKDYLDIDKKTALIADSGIPDQWVDLAAGQFSDCTVLRFPQGEQSKSIEVWKELLEQLAACHFNRKSQIVALGGGVTGDLAGFVAASYMRGIDFYNIPTTVLSQVDSSVGGKVAVDLDGYKNIVGAFWQPKAVIIDPEVLSTLPRRQISNGLAEALKMGCILDAGLIAAFEEDELDLERIIAASIALKAQIVEQDEREGGLRSILNFGHTIGHAIESAYHLNDYLHGECVAMGMLFFLEDEDLKERVRKIYERLHLPALPVYDPALIAGYIRNDKKSAGDTIKVIKVRKAGSWEMEMLSHEQILDLLEAGA